MKICLLQKQSYWTFHTRCCCFFSWVVKFFYHHILLECVLNASTHNIFNTSDTTAHQIIIVFFFQQFFTHHISGNRKMVNPNRNPSFSLSVPSRFQRSMWAVSQATSQPKRSCFYGASRQQKATPASAVSTSPHPGATDACSMLCCTDTG